MKGLLIRLYYIVTPLLFIGLIIATLVLSGFVTYYLNILLFLLLLVNRGFIVNSEFRDVDGISEKKAIHYKLAYNALIATHVLIFTTIHILQYYFMFMVDGGV